MEISVCHFYGVEIKNVPLREELEKSKSHFADYIESVNLNRDKIYRNETPIKHTKNSPEITWGPGHTVQIGYEMIAPFEESNPLPKEELDRQIYEVAAYLFGEKEAKSCGEPQVYFYGYDEDNEDIY